MKIDRLLGITLYLLNRDRVSANKLAEKFEVSQRTIQRDIDSLNIAGIPITSLPGINGGYEILDSFKLNKQISSTDDYLFIITALKGLCSAYNNKKLDMTIEKVVQASIENTEIKQKLFLDLQVLHEGDYTDLYMKLIENSINEETSIKFDYTNANNNVSHRIIEPIALTYKWYSWYLLGFCLEKCDYRLFKLCRIDNLEKTNINFTKLHKPADILLSQLENKDVRQYYDIKLLCKMEIKKQVLEYIKGTIIEEFENGDFLLSLHVPENERMWFSIILGFGNKVIVIEPNELKFRLKEKAEEILYLYKD